LIYSQYREGSIVLYRIKGNAVRGNTVQFPEQRKTPQAYEQYAKRCNQEQGIAI
jgi:hypothetical protein